jgi:predicted transglutaminase-like cysteine proteinase
MGKAQIITDYGNGLYRIKIIYGGRTQFNNRISILTQAISDLQDRIDAETDDYQKKLLKLEKAALEKSKSYLQDKFPDDYEINVFCCDLTEGLSGNIGTIDIPGEAFEIKIQPGYSGNANYNSARDGIIWPSIAGSADWCYFNQAIMPGWQKHKPTYRIARIVAGSINTGAHTCDVCIGGAFSSQQNLNVNQDVAIQGCPANEESGFADFCSRNPSHPTCTNTTEPSPLNAGETLFAKIKEINLDVNSSHEYQSDSSGWRVQEYWDIMSAGEKGDCEDFALTKMQALLDYGVGVEHLQIATCAVEQGLGWHAVLMIQTQNRGTLVLDNRFDKVLTKETLQNFGYQWDTYQAAGRSWNSFSTKLIGVPIEYMTCHSLVFADDDQVVLKFVDQDWANPKVIGFQTDPESCDPCLWAIFGESWPNPSGATEFNIATKTGLTSLIEAPSWQAGASWRHAAGFILSGAIYTCGGEFVEISEWPTPDFSIDLTAKKFSPIKGQGEGVMSNISDMIAPARARAIGFSLDSKGYIVTGTTDRIEAVTDQMFATKANHKFDPDTGSWTTKQNINIGRLEASSFADDQYGYVWAGYKNWIYHGEGGPRWDYSKPEDALESAERYDPVANSWAYRNNSPQAVFAQTSNELYGKGIGCFGYAENFNEYPDPYASTIGWPRQDAQVYNPATNSWITTGDAPQYQFGQEDTDLSSTFSYPGGMAFEKFYLFTPVVSGIYQYNPSGNSWSKYFETVNEGLNIHRYSIGGVIW